ncbi:PLP-dependent transferase [Hypoxylon sp. FL1284]|nr:PLP-dependent transferase [Hypoxylon sp. FL1284]
MTDMDMQAVRAKFPALRDDQVFLDNAGGSQTLGTVIDSIRDYLINSNAQFGGGYQASQRAVSRYNDGVEAGAKFLNAHKDEIAFGASATQLLRNLSMALPFEQGDEIIVSALDHEANVAPWKDVAARLNLTLKWWKPSHPTNPQLLAADLAPLLSARTRLVALTHASNVLGTVHDVGAIAAAVRAASPEALVCVDGVAYAPHRPVDAAALGADFYVLSWYKVFGPHVAMLYGSRAAQRRMRSLGHFFNPSDTLERKIGFGSTSYELVASIPAAVAYTGPPSSPEWAAVAAQESALQARLLGYLTGGRPSREIVVYGEADPRATASRVPVVSFRVAGGDSRELVEELERRSAEGPGPGFGFRWGAFYSNTLVYDVLRLPPDGVVRVSMAHYNTVEEIDGFIEALDKLIAE